LKTRCFLLILSVIILDSCTSTKNTGGTRWYHSFNTRYNVYFNGIQAYEAALKAQLEGYEENYSEMIYMHPVSSLAKGKETTGGQFDKSLEKAVKAIKMHSIQTKPQRNPRKAGDPKYRAFLNRKEFNPFLHNAWMLMGQSQFFNGDFLEAASSFSYISRLYESQPEIAIPSQLWKARSYVGMGWYYDADNILSKMNVAQLTNSQRNLYSTVYADYYVKQKQYAQAIPYLKVAIQSEKNKLQKTRVKYLLGQLYTATNQKDLAYNTFGEISRSNVPYVLELNAKIRQTEVYPGGDINKISKQLTQMTKSSKNEQYLDQIYYALGNVYMTIPDTANAIKSYELGIEKSTRNGIDKALNQLKAGDIYFNQRKYIKAQPNYSGALTQLKKSDEAYPRVSKRSEALDALLIPYQAVELQDSLQHLSRMTEDERMAVVKKIIEDLIKKEKEEAKKSQLNQYQAQQEALQSQQPTNRLNPGMNAIVPPAPGGTGTFYFYNEQMVAIGKNMFQQKWGRRNLEDDWRRRNKSGTIQGSNEELAATDSTIFAGAANDSISKNINSNDSLNLSSEAKEASNDPKDPQFYLQQIPTTEEEIAASNLIISDGLYNMGVIYKDMLEDNPLALETFQTLDTRFPNNKNKLSAYYYMFLIYWQEGNAEMVELYKAKIREGFPNSDLAVAMSDPYYEHNQLTMDSVQEALYQQTYADYLAGYVQAVRQNYETVVTKFSQSKLMPKFMLLNALSFAATNEADTFKVLLKQLVNKYPKDDVSALASDMIKGFQRGLLLSSSGDNMLARGSLFNTRFVGEGGDAAADSTIQFSAEITSPHGLLLIYSKESLDDNVLYYTVAGYNFGNFTVNDFALEKTTAGETGMLQIKGFNSLGQVMQYLQKIQQPGGYAKEWSRLVIPVPISEANYNVLMKGKSMDEYMTFFEKQFGQGNEDLIADWRIKQAEEMKVAPETQKENLLSDIDKNKTGEMQSPKTTLPTDSAQTTLQADTLHSTVQTIQPDSTDATTAKTDSIFNKSLEKVNDIYTEASDKMNDVTNKFNTIALDPVRGILNLFKRDKKNNAIEEFAKQQEKEDKAQQLQLKKEQDEKDKAAKAEALLKEKEQNEAAKKKAEEDKAALEAKQKEQNDLAKQKENDKKQKENEKKQKEADRKRLAKEKQDALKKKTAEQKAKEKARKEEQNRKAKERETLRKQKEKEREELRKQKEKERK